MLRPVFHKRCVRVNGVAMRGLHKAMKATFWPRYGRRAAEKRNVTVRTDHVKVKTPRGSDRATAVGSWVDRAVTRMVELCRRHSWREVCDGALPSWRAHRGAAMVAPLIKWLQAQGLEPVGAQEAVALPDARVGTMPDLLVRHATEGWVTAVEIKCGYQDYLWHGTRWSMRAPFGGLPSDAPGYQHMVQVFLTGVICRHTFRAQGRAELAPFRPEKGAVVVLHRDPTQAPRVLPLAMFPDVFNERTAEAALAQLRDTKYDGLKRKRRWVDKCGQEVRVVKRPRDLLR